MLKAIRFNNEHKDLIQYIENYRDDKNQPNHSEAMRYLMTLGLEYLKQPKTKETLDFNSMKQELLSELLMELNKNEISRASAFTIVNSNELPQHINETVQPEIKKKKVEIPKEFSTNPLLANILNNAQR